MCLPSARKHTARARATWKAARVRLVERLDDEIDLMMIDGDLLFALSSVAFLAYLGANCWP